MFIGGSACNNPSVSESFVLTLSCLDRPGIVRALAEGVVAAGGNIVESAQFSDPVTGLFCVRTHFDAPGRVLAEVEDIVAGRLAPYQPRLTLRPADRRCRVAIMVSRFDHCLVDLLYRWYLGELEIDVPVIISNHPDARGAAERYGIPFVHIPVTRDTKAQAEQALFEQIEEHQIDLVVLARYMQVLSDDACVRLGGRAINIHHSFLPGFKGAKPYHQAYERGVKLIGATAHYVTSDLDEGPIIEQDVVRVSHAQDAETMVSIGRDVERVVLARAVKLHSQDRVLLAGSRTVVFS